MRVRRQTVVHPFGTIKSWMESTHFQMKTLKHVGTGGKCAGMSGPLSLPRQQHGDRERAESDEGDDGVDRV